VIEVKKAVLILAAALLAVAMLATLAGSVFAFGPVNAIGKNPLLSDFDDCSLEPPNHVWIAWLQDEGMVRHWIPAKPSDKGILNNVALVVDTSTELRNVGQNPGAYEGVWVYLSGEYMGGTWSSSRYPSEGPHGAVYWLFRNFMSASDSLEKAMEQPYGVYTRLHFVGWS